jgi:hypothetical protein
VKIFTKEEAEIWMKSKSVDLAEYNLIQSEQIPNDSGRKNYISKKISNLKYGKECLLYINEYGIWPSSENMDLFNGYRKSIGINESLPEKSAHLIDVSENKELYCLLCMVLYFCWGALLIPENTNEMIRISHDEYIEVLVKRDVSKRNTFTSEFSSIFN